MQLDPNQPPVAVPVDNDALHQIADLSGGQFFTASTESQLRQVYSRLGEQIGYETRLVDRPGPGWPAAPC